MKKIITAIIALGMTTGCAKEVKTLPANVITPTTDSESIPVISDEVETNLKSADNLILKTRENVEVYEIMKIGDFVTKTNAEIVNGEEMLDTSELGEKEVTIELLCDDNKIEKKIKYTVEDTTPPVLLNMGNEPYVTQNEPFDLKKIVGYADNYDTSPTLTYDGTVDTNTIGTYPITAHVKDSSGNEISWDVTVIVLSKVPESEGGEAGTPDYSDGTKFEDFISANDGNNRKFGIDVSSWQGDIDFNAVKNAGCDFVIIRMGYFYDEIKPDDWYAENIRKARNAGLEVGVYFYTTLNTADKVKELTGYINEQLDGQKLDFPIAFDWEDFDTFQEYGLSIHGLNELFNLFCAEMENYGYSGMLYSSKNFLKEFWINNYNQPVWLAHYVDETDYKGDYFMWQGSSTGLIDGIDGYVDMNVLYTNK